MKFLFPSFLWALLAIAIPIIIHLLNFRRYKKVYFTNVHLLKEIKLEKNRTDSIKRWLILASRVLAIIFLVLAFAQPYISKNTQALGGSKRVSFYLDNSFSMQQSINNNALLEEAKQKAIEIISSYNISDEFILITNDLKYNQLRWMSKEEMIQELSAVKPSPANLLLSEVAEIQNQQSEEKRESIFEAYIISDFQSHFSDAIQKKEGFQTYLIPLKGTEARNLYIDSCWLLSPVLVPQTYVKLVAKIVNSGNTEIENRRVTLKINKEVKGILDINIKPNSSIIDTFTIFLREAGNHNLQLTVSDFPITHDDDFYLNFEVAAQIKVLEVNEKPTDNHFAAIFKEDNYVLHEVQNVNQINYSAFENYGLIILNGLASISSGLEQSLKKYMEEGGALYIIPPTQNIQELNKFLNAVSLPSYGAYTEESQQVSKVNFEDPIFKTVFKKEQVNMDLPLVSKYYFFQNNQNKGVPLLTLRNGNPLVVKQTTGKSTAFVQSVSLNKDFSNLTNHAMFPAMVYNFVLNSQPLQPLYQIIKPGVSFQVSKVLPERDKMVKIVSENFEFIPEQRRVGNKLVLFPGTTIQESGHFNIVNDEETIAITSFNFDRNESEFSFLKEEEIKNQFSTDNITTVLTSSVSDFAQVSGGIRLWKICIILCLIFLAAEIVLIRFFTSRQTTS
jgi:hypothetical protein